MKEGYSSKQKQIYQDYVLYGNDSLLEILRNKGEYSSAVIKIIKDILDERKSGFSSSVTETVFTQGSSGTYPANSVEQGFHDDVEPEPEDHLTKFINELREKDESDLEKIITKYNSYTPERVHAALFVLVEKGVISVELKEQLLTQIESNFASQSKRYKQRKWEANNAFIGYVSKYQDEDIYNYIEDPGDIVIDVYHAILLTARERELITQEDFDEYFVRAKSIIRTDREVVDEDFFETFNDPAPPVGYETDAALEAEAEKYWICPSCDETVGVELDVCWNCQTKIPETLMHPDKEEVIKEINTRKPVDPVKSGWIAIGCGVGVGLIEMTGSHTHYFRVLFCALIVLGGIVMVFSGLSSGTKRKS